jgi:hypothetical protein
MNLGDPHAVFGVYFVFLIFQEEEEEEEEKNGSVDL